MEAVQATPDPAGTGSLMGPSVDGRIPVADGVGVAGMRGLVRRINQHTGSGLVHLGDADSGETSGAAYVRWPDGRRSVVTHATVSATRMRQTAHVLEMARDRGLPVPRHKLTVELDHGVVAVAQEQLPGTRAAHIDAAVIDALVAVNDRFAGLLAQRPDVPVPPLNLPRAGTSDPRYELVNRYSDRSRRLLRRIQEIGAASPAEMTGTDLVHPDFTAPNVLFDDAGQVTGVIDWNNGAARGDRHHALVKLLFDLTWDAASPTGGHQHVQAGATDRLETHLHQTVAPHLLRLYWAHWTLTMLNWTIPAGDPAVVDLHLDLGERGLN